MIDTKVSTFCPITGPCEVRDGDRKSMDNPEGVVFKGGQRAAQDFSRGYSIAKLHQTRTIVSWCRSEEASKKYDDPLAHEGLDMEAAGDAIEEKFLHD